MSRSGGAAQAERPDPASRVAHNPVVRTFWLLAGFGATGLGFVGLVVPGVPFLGCFVAAAACFSRSSPRFEQWVLNLPKVGPMVRDYRAGLGMPLRIKKIATATMWMAVLVSSFLVRSHWWLSAIILAAGAIGTLVIWLRVPTREDVVAASEV